ncbi:CD1871A family CXXC motif-containing protein [Enterocloster citroniae]|uniref:Thioredoxin n=1 Tax=[Clostridium] citroniae WAL-17108 TaxID=742733 RepID=G5HBP3_9FIRM|nr:CD1871A family CXXC motif-containing protein [Enterocloster citroniae]EHF01128.1 hypothetical protein HMPREF9469_00005 [ [[Clostridium] citroniae WAL-17108]
MKNKLFKNRWAVTMLAAGLMFIAAGVYRQEAGTVLTKAAAICLECIGIG